MTISRLISYEVQVGKYIALLQVAITDRPNVKVRTEVDP